MIHELPSTSLIFLHLTTHTHTYALSYFSIIHTVTSEFFPILFLFFVHLNAQIHKGGTRHWSNINASYTYMWHKQNMLFFSSRYVFVLICRYAAKKNRKRYEKNEHFRGWKKKETIKKIIGTLQTRSLLRLFSHPFSHLLLLCMYLYVA